MTGRLRNAEDGMRKAERRVSGTHRNSERDGCQEPMAIRRAVFLALHGHNPAANLSTSGRSAWMWRGSPCSSTATMPAMESGLPGAARSGSRPAAATGFARLRRQIVFLNFLFFG